MKPIHEKDYYGIFQTGLLIALEVLGIKQAQLAVVCEISEGYLSKLKGWNLNQESGRPLLRPHSTNTNFKRYTIPLLQFLEQEHQIRFNEGYFITLPENTIAGKWGDLNTIQLQARPKQEKFAKLAPPILENLIIPEKGELIIELSNQNNIQDLLTLLDYLAGLSNTQLKIKILLNNNQMQPSNGDNRFQRVSGRIPIDPLSALRRNNYTARNINLQIESSGNRFFDLISINDVDRGVRQEQFCDYSDWKTLHREGDWNITPQFHIIQGSGMYQYLLSRYDYGSVAFSLYAVIQFNGYAQHAEMGSETANAGIILGWKQVEDRYQYYNLLLDGKTMLLEQVGARTGDHWDDYQHLDSGVPFAIEEGSEYQFLVQVTPERVSVFVDKVLRYQIATPPGIEGRVGIRPWRTQVVCSYFEIREVQ
ncbi:MAG: hypothetical protein JNN28_09380 [Saprospiraceae bacterium]|nr:hypothetical protein [Saprospiraceae bacterium]